MQDRLGTALIAEFIGTFALIFIGAGAGALGVGVVGVAFAHGLVVLAFAYAYGHHSGTHVNPAVTAGLLAAGKIDVKRAVSYWFFQLLGGIVGAFALRAVLGGSETGLGLPKLAENLQVGSSYISISPLSGLLIEAILAFFLLNTVLNAGVSGKGGNLAGVAIGMTLVFNILMGGPLTGAAFNPARYLGPAVAVGDFRNAWVYLVGPLLGAVVAGLLYKMVFEERSRR
jgi:aquaporin Z